MQIRCIHVLMACLFMVCTAFSARAGDEKTGLFWSVKAKKANLYLLGTVHMPVTTGDLSLGEGIEAAYRGSRRVVFEADPEELGHDDVRRALTAAGMYKAGDSLKRHISKKTSDLLEQRAKKAGIPFRTLEAYKPWFCAVTVSGASLKKMGLDPGQGMAARFYGRARSDGKDMVFFETSGYQIDLLSEVLSERQEEVLLQALKEIRVIEKMSSEMQRAWHSGDSARIEEICGMSLKEYPEIRETLFDERNSRWVSRISDLAGMEGDSFIVVGAAHLVGEKGVVALLKKKGYVITRQ